VSEVLPHVLSPGPTPRHRARGPADFGRRGLPGQTGGAEERPGARGYPPCGCGARRAGSGYPPDRVGAGPRCRGAGPGRRPADFRHIWL